MAASTANGQKKSRKLASMSSTVTCVLQMVRLVRSATPFWEGDLEQFFHKRYHEIYNELPFVLERVREHCRVCKRSSDLELKATTEVVVALSSCEAEYLACASPLAAITFP